MEICKSSEFLWKHIMVQNKMFYIFQTNAPNLTKNYIVNPGSWQYAYLITSYEDAFWGSYRGADKQANKKTKRQTETKDFLWLHCEPPLTLHKLHKYL